MARPRLVYLTRDGCGLCDQALPHVRKAARLLYCEVTVVDLAANADWEAEYHLRIPVVLDNKGRVVAEGVIGFKDAVLGAIKAWR